MFGVIFETKDADYLHRKFRVLIIRTSELESSAFDWTARPPRERDNYFIDR